MTDLAVACGAASETWPLGALQAKLPSPGRMLPEMPIEPMRSRSRRAIEVVRGKSEFGSSWDAINYKSAFRTPNLFTSEFPLPNSHFRISSDPLADGAAFVDSD